MADKKISDLTAIGINCVSTDLFVTEHAAGGSAVKATLTQVTAVETAAREAQDDVIEASAGFTAAGAYQAPAGSHYLGASTTVRNALGLLDDEIYALDAVVSGLSTYVTTKVTISNAEMLSLHAANKTLIAAGGANTVIEIVSVFAHSQPIDVDFADGANIEVKYSGDTDFLFDLDNTLIKTAGCAVIRGIAGTLKELQINTAIVANCDAAYTAGDGSVDIYIAYRIVTLTACPY